MLTGAWHTSSVHFELPHTTLRRVVDNWCSEFGKWAPDFVVIKYHGSAQERAQLMVSPAGAYPIPRGGGACLFQNGGCLLLIPPLPFPPRVGVGQEWVGGFEVKGYSWCRRRGKIFSFIISFMLVSP